MNVLFLCVNFNSYVELRSYLETIFQAVKGSLSSNLDINVEIVVSDNSDHYEALNTSVYEIPEHLKIVIDSHCENLGYLGGCDRLIGNLPRNYIERFNYIVVSNVDVLLSLSFFTDLLALEVADNVGWISPSIISLKEKKDRNPKIIHKPSLLKLRLLYLTFICPFANWLYVNLVYKRRKKTRTHNKRGKIYAGHGSFMVFTSYFFQKYQNFRFGSFLFCEEIHIAELVRLSGLDVIYDPSVKIEDIDHVSTGVMNSSKYCKWNRDSIRFIINQYYNE